MTRLGKMLLAPSALLAGVSAAHAGPCDIVDARTTSVVSAPAAGAYDVFDPVRAETSFQVTLENTEVTRQNCRVVFLTPTGTGLATALGSPDELRFDIRRENGTGRLTVAEGSATLNPRTSVNLDGNSEQTVNFIYSPRAREFDEPGAYSATVTIATFVQQDPAVILDEAVLNVSTLIEAQGNLFVAVERRPGTDDAFKTAFLDFGTIEKSERGVRLSFVVQSNGRYQFQVASENGGRLVLENGEEAVAGFDNFIEYTVNREAVSDTPEDLADVFDPTRFRGDRRNFLVLISRGPNRRRDLNTLEGKLAGRYSDTLTFTIVPRE